MLRQLFSYERRKHHDPLSILTSPVLASIKASMFLESFLVHVNSDPIRAQLIESTVIELPLVSKLEGRMLELHKRDKLRDYQRIIGASNWRPSLRMRRLRLCSTGVILELCITRCVTMHISSFCILCIYCSVQS